MDKVLEFQNFPQLASEKIDAELKAFSGDRYGQAVKDYVAAMLKHFCEESPKFAEVVYKTRRTLSDCCSAIMKGCGNSISDIDVYRGAVRHYFPNADIDFHMTITINGDAPTAEEMAKVPEHPKKAQKLAPKVEMPKREVPVTKAKPVENTKPKVIKKQKKAKTPQEPEVIQLTLF